MRKWIVTAMIVHACICLHAQAGQPDLTFGNVKPEDFAPAVYAVDSNAEAVYLFDVGSAYFHETEDNHFEVVRQRHERIRILSRNAFDMATLILSLYNDEYKENADNIEAATYNLKDGKVVAEPIGRNAVFTEKDKGENKIKLTLPDVKVGSIIEFSYIIKTPGIQLPEWNFQGKYPRLWSRYEVVNPYFFNFAVLKQGTLSFVVDSTSTFHTDYNYQYYPANEVNTLQHTWVMKNVPGIAEEPFTNTIENYVARIEFQLSAYRNSYGNYVSVGSNWTNICLNLMNNPGFGSEEDKDGRMLTALVKSIQGADTENIETAKHIYAYVRDNYTCTFPYGKFRTQDVKKTVQSKSGTEADLNLLLIALLSKDGLQVRPVILSTTGHGTIKYEYPTVPKYNYVICQLTLNKKQYFLDGSHKFLTFGELDDECYNGYARVIDETHSVGIFLSPNSLNDSVTSSVVLKSGEDEAEVTTRLSAQPSIEARKLITGNPKENNNKIIKEDVLNETTIQDITVKGLSDADSALSISYHVPVELFTEDLVYFSPMLSLQTKSNPFSAATRIYPLEMPYCREDVYAMKMDIPKGYEIDELPKPVSVKNDSLAAGFDYSITSDANSISLHVSSKLGRAVYQPQEYQSLRNFFSEVIAKEAEQIVFKKLK